MSAEDNEFRDELLEAQDAEERWENIPSNKLGETPDALYDDDPKLCRAIIARRAMESAYEEVEDPEESIKDLLIDLRHLCDKLELDFSEINDNAYDCYTVENAGNIS